ncbi:hypothetical protein QVD17_15319 [Tagetes erecta]|uniref:Uncharacterized protein n=1 Tax=Tagetes erecta TaxID=13708 RepID=A0AAD8KUP3_TARER|nr:hypothetical protein QVD17_15319 [Tagetes erecta]
MQWCAIRFKELCKARRIRIGFSRLDSATKGSILDIRCSGFVNTRQEKASFNSDLSLIWLMFFLLCVTAFSGQIGHCIYRRLYPANNSCSAERGEIEV